MSVFNPDGRYTEFLVIDGQQRLTTVSLLLLAIYNLTKEGVIIPATPSLTQEIYEGYLVDKFQPEETRIKLKPVKNDQRALGKLFEDKKEHIKDSNLTANYSYFYDRIQKQEITIDELFDAICRLEVIDIRLNNEDNPQLIFESLNSTGLDLSEGDKIRNFVLMGLPSKEQEVYYEKYWNRIEECTGYDASSFIRDYLSLKQQSNLTLTAYNSAYSNSSFLEKKSMKNGFDDSGLRMNTYISKKEKWTLTGLEDRSQYLRGRAIEIWAAPVTTFKPQEKQMDTYTLDDDENLSGRTIIRFRYKNAEQPVTSWVEMFQKVFQILYAEDKSVITRLAVSSDENIGYHFSIGPHELLKSVEIGDGIYVLTNTSTQSKLSVLNRVFKLYDADPSDLVFYLRDESEALEDENGPRYALRRQYWAYALPIIKEAHGENGPFSNVNPSSMNWVNGFFGVNGFNLCCVANYDSARVEVYLGHADRDVNKQTFDALIKHKGEIESALGIALQWSRGDDIKSSKVYYMLNNVSIEHEVDWLQMARFHAEWSKKFYDVIVPYLLRT